MGRPNRDSSVAISSTSGVVLPYWKRPVSVTMPV